MKENKIAVVLSYIGAAVVLSYIYEMSARLRQLPSLEFLMPPKATTQVLKLPQKALPSPSFPPNEEDAQDQLSATKERSNQGLSTATGTTKERTPVTQRNAKALGRMCLQGR